MYYTVEYSTQWNIQVVFYNSKEVCCLILCVKLANNFKTNCSNFKNIIL